MTIELSSANALLLFNLYALVGTKVYDYVGLRRRILLCFSEDPEALRIKEEIYHLPTAGMEGHRPMERLIAETNAGVVVKDADQLERVLRDMLDEFEQSGSISCPAHEYRRALAQDPGRTHVGDSQGDRLLRKVVIVDFGMGNLHSVFRNIERIGGAPVISSEPARGRRGRDAGASRASATSPRRWTTWQIA